LASNNNHPLKKRGAPAGPGCASLSVSSQVKQPKSDSQYT